MNAVRRILFILLVAASAIPIASSAQSTPDRPFVVEYYYKTKWGHADEFLKLFKKNHYPLLKKEVETGPDGEGLDGPAPLPHHRRRPLGFPRDHRLQERQRRQRTLR